MMAALHPFGCACGTCRRPHPADRFWSLTDVLIVAGIMAMIWAGPVHFVERSVHGYLRCRQIGCLPGGVPS